MIANILGDKVPSVMSKVCSECLETKYVALSFISKSDKCDDCRKTKGNPEVKGDPKLKWRRFKV